MNSDILKLMKTHLFSPFFETNETLEVKNYLFNVIAKEKFDGIKVGIVQFCDSPILRKKLKLYHTSDNVMKIVSIDNNGKVNINFDTIKKNPNLLKFYTSRRNVLGFYNKSEKNKIWITVDNCIHSYSKVKIPTIAKIKHFDINKDFINVCCTSMRNSLYHEARHVEQFSKSDNSFESIMAQIDYSIISGIFSNKLYYLFHDEFFVEIDANVTADERTKEYIKNNPSDKKMLKNVSRDINRLRKYGYNFDKFFTIYNNNRLISSFKNKDVFNSQDLAWQKLLYGNGKKLRHLNNIVNDDLMSHVDHKFLCLVFTSEYFNRNLNYNELSEKAIENLINCFTKIKSETNKNIRHILDLKFKDKKKKKLKFKYIAELRERLNRYDKSLDLLNEVKRNKKRAVIQRKDQMVHQKKKLR